MTAPTLDTTVFAHASVDRPSARAVVRISGPDAHAIVDNVFTPDAGATPARRCARPGAIDLDGVSVRGWAWRFVSPHSYTGEDAIEIHLPGCPPVLRMLEQRLMDGGAAPARPGEFTARAMLNGRLDLPQAEAVNTVIQAQSDARIDAALANLGGAMHDHIDRAWRDLTGLLADVEADIDFGEEHQVNLPLGDLRKRIETIGQTIRSLLAAAVDAETLGRMPTVVLVGPVNVGKSSLLNRLTGVDRAICSPLPGATRDMISAAWPHRDHEVMLVDSAGLTDRAADALTQRAAEQTTGRLDTFDLVVAIFDATRPLEAQSRHLDPAALAVDRTILAINKADLAAPNIDTLEQQYATVIFVSALTGRGLNALADAVFDRLEQSAPPAHAQRLAINRRQRHALTAAGDAIDRAVDDATDLQRGQGPLGVEIVASQLQLALRHLAELLGKDPTDNVLDTIFSTFCIGK